MAHINLLPWREKARAKRQADFGVAMLAGVLLTAGLLAGWHFFNEGLIDHQKARNGYLQAQIAEVDKQIKEIKELERTRKQLIDRMTVVASLQSARPQIVHLFDELVSSLPEGVYLTQITQTQNAVSVLGKAQSNARVSAYMRGVQASPWLDKPNLRIIENKGAEKQGDSTFSLGMVQVVKQSEEDEK